MTPVLFYSYTGHSLGLPGTVAVIVAVVARVTWMFARRKRDRS